jgi:Tol biopolymer transport system component/predicted Ser/Thr protein kinase
MAIEVGARLGPYEIEDVIGAGGMGEVYRARDTRLERMVAIKVLAQHLAEKPEHRQRLEREAKAISSLSHPNICPLYDVGHEDGVDFLVMEFIEGESLADRLTRGPLPLDEVLRYGTEIADALEKAHKQGIVHRDLKPGNVMLAADGTKLLDFGLARTDLALDGEGDLTVSPTVSKPLTAAGTVIGTYQYMAPEQLEGRTSDARTDIFALGALLYEMAAGRRAFAAETQASMIGAIMHETPQPISTLQPMIPPAFDRVVQSCLAKDPDERWQTAHDVKLQLQWISEGGSVVGLPAPVAARRKSRERLAWIAAVVAAVAAILFGVGFVLRAPEAPQRIRFQIQPPPELTFVGSPRISPDGRYVAFRGGGEDGSARIWLHPLNSLEPYPLAGTEGVRTDSRPFWSPDSRQIGFFTDGQKVKRVPVEGGVVQTICDADSADGTWGADGEILFDAENDSVNLVSAGGGVARAIVTPAEDDEEVNAAWPDFLPDGKHFLYVLEFNDGSMKVMLGEIGGKKGIEICDTDSRVQFAEPGYLLYVRNSTLLALPFSARSRQVIGEPIPIADNVEAASYGLADFSASTTGTLIYRGGGSEAGFHQLQWRDRNGADLGSIGEPEAYMNHWLSPDGDRVVTQVLGGDEGASDLWILDEETGVNSRFTFDPAWDVTPVWSPDGSKIVFSSDRGGQTFELFVKNASGGGEVEELLVGKGRAHPGDWTRDGSYLSYTPRHEDTHWDLWALPMNGGGDPFPIANTEAIEIRASFSPDGRWIAYQVYDDVSDQQPEIFVQRFPKGSGKWQVTKEGGWEPYWTKEGTEIIFRDDSWNFFAVPVETGETFRAGVPEPLFQGNAVPMILRNYYQVTADGERFLLLEPATLGSTLQTSVILNWTAGLEP